MSGSTKMAQLISDNDTLGKSRALKKRRKQQREAGYPPGNGLFLGEGQDRSFRGEQKSHQGKEKGKVLVPEQGRKNTA